MEEIRRILVIAEDIAVHGAYGRIEKTTAYGEVFSRPVQGTSEQRGAGKQRLKFICTTDAEEAMDLLIRSKKEDKPFSVTFIHMKRSGSDGIGIARRIRKRDPDVKVVVASGFRESSWEELVDICEEESLFFLRNSVSSDEIIQFAELLAGLWVKETEKKRIYGDLIKAGLRKGMNPVLRNERIEPLLHQLKTPVASILGFCDTVLSDRNMPEEVREEFLKIIRMEGEKLDRIIDNLREIF